jgi:hypothetical protein
MRSGGFPCRVSGCGVQFGVQDSSSMESLLQASAARTAHEASTHNYTHPRPPEEPRRGSPYIAKTRPKNA